MRPKERIPIFLKLVNWDALEEKWDVDISPTLRSKLYLNSEIIKYWLENYDQRFGQMLINQGLLPDSLRVWCDEENDILDDQNVSPREYLLWGKCYDKDMNPLPKIEWILIKDMSTDHIKAILRDVEEHKMGCKENYLKAFKEEIKLRNNEKKK